MAGREFAIFLVYFLGLYISISDLAIVGKERSVTSGSLPPLRNVTLFLTVSTALIGLSCLYDFWRT